MIDRPGRPPQIMADTSASERLPPWTLGNSGISLDTERSPIA